jgi:hypothetical protein
MNMYINLMHTTLYSTSQKITRTLAWNLMCKHDCTKVWPGRLATHDVFAERRLRAWRSDIRYTIMSSYLFIYSIQSFSFSFVLPSLAETLYHRT